MAKLSHLVEYSLLGTLRMLAGIPTARMADRLGAGLGKLAHDLLKSRRLVARDNLKQAMGEQYSDVELDPLCIFLF